MALGVTIAVLGMKADEKQKERRCDRIDRASLVAGQREDEMAALLGGACVPLHGEPAGEKELSRLRPIFSENVASMRPGIARALEAGGFEEGCGWTALRMMCYDRGKVFYFSRSAMLFRAASRRAISSLEKSHFLFAGSRHEGRDCAMLYCILALKSIWRGTRRGNPV